MESAAAAAARQRKACISCYQKKVRCDFLPQANECIRCTQNGLECVLPTEAQKVSRPSMRSGFDDLSSRVRQLEDAVFLAQGSASGPVYGTARFAELSGTTSSNGQGDSPILPPKPPAVRAYRGDTSPWVSLLDHVDSKVELDRQFQETAHKLAEEERSNNFSTNAISYDIIQAFPHLQRADVLHHVTAYAIDAPYPILHYDSLMEITEQVLDTHRLARCGQLACILMYMAFGSTLVLSEQSSAELHRQAQVYLQAAWGIMPQLILDHDLWALKGLTLMVHYLQASSNPETCWTLLGSASRLAVSLGFHQKTRKVDTYSAIEAEEGRRAWWLCLIMEKTFCTTLGYPSTSPSSASVSENDRPSPFQPTGRRSSLRSPLLDANPNAIFGTNELSAAAFFADMIHLTRLRDSILNSSPPNIATIPSSPAAEESTISALLRSTLRDAAQGAFNPSSSSSSPPNLRASISDLAHYNAVQVIAVHLCHPSKPKSNAQANASSGSGSGSGSKLPTEALLSARATLQTILETRTNGTTMCLWMWLYYAFTASVVLFLSIVGDGDPEGEGVVRDLALLDELAELCGVLGGGGGAGSRGPASSVERNPSSGSLGGGGEGSEGARRVKQIVDAMGRVAWEVVKRRARSKGSRKRGVSLHGNEGEEGTPGAQPKSKRLRSSGGEREPGQEEEQEEGGEAAGAEAAGEEEVLDLDLDLHSAPQNFEWEEWDQWLADADAGFDLE